MDSNADADRAEIDRLKAEVESYSDIGRKAYMAAAELLVEWGNMPAEYTDEESEMMVDAVAELTASENYPHGKPGDDLVSYFVRLLNEAWRMVKKRKGKNQQAPGGNSAPVFDDDMPRPGANGATWDDLFNWYYHRGGRNKYSKIKDLAEPLGMVERTVYNNHSLYRAQHGGGQSQNEVSSLNG